MSDRIVIMTPRPGRIDQILSVELERPRDRNGADFLALRSRILELLHLAGHSSRHNEFRSADERVACERH